MQTGIESVWTYTAKSFSVMTLPRVFFRFSCSPKERSPAIIFKRAFASLMLPSAFTGALLKNCSCLRCNTNSLIRSRKEASCRDIAKGTDRRAPAEIPEMISGRYPFSKRIVSAAPNRPEILVPPPEIPKCFIGNDLSLADGLRGIYEEGKNSFYSLRFPSQPVWLRAMVPARTQM